MLLEDVTVDIVPVLTDIAWQAPPEAAKRWRVERAQPPAGVVRDIGNLAFLPSPLQRWHAAAQLRLALLAAIEPALRDVTPDNSGLQRLICDSDLRMRADVAIDKAASRMRMAGRQDLLQAMDRVGFEHAAVEALRQGVLHPLQRRARAQLALPVSLLEASFETKQRQRQLGVSLGRIAGAFMVIDAEIDAQIEDVMETLVSADSNAEGLRRLIDLVVRDAGGMKELLT